MEETKRALITAANEIRALRRTNELLHAKVSTMDLFALVLNTRANYPSQCDGEDVVWMLEKQLRALDGVEPEKTI